MNTAEAGPLLFGLNVSDNDPVATANTGPQQNPAINLKKHNDPKLCVNPAPRVNSAPSGSDHR